MASVPGDPLTHTHTHCGRVCVVFANQSSLCVKRLCVSGEQLRKLCMAAPLHSAPLGFETREGQIYMFVEVPSINQSSCSSLLHLSDVSGRRKNVSEHL